MTTRKGTVSATREAAVTIGPSGRTHGPAGHDAGDAARDGG